MVTLKDVAKRAGVSVSTASYSINGSSLITKDTKEKVLTAAKEIGYRPNGLAKNLKEQKTNIIGLFLSGFTGPFFNDMVEGIQDIVMKNNYELVVCATSDTHRLLVERYVDGAIILNYHMEDELLASLANERLPCVVLDRELQNPYIKSVLLPNEEGSIIAVRYLLEKGHKRFGYIAGSEESYDGETRLQGFRNELYHQGVVFSDQDLIRADFTEISGYEEMRRYLSESDGNLPTAIVCANDEMALGAIKAIQEKNLKVPEEIAVVGFDDIYMSHFFNPSLTTIRVPRKEWGIAAAQTLFKMLEQKFDFEPDPLKVELMSRTSG
ncbi:LacI family DNA-binding transcriptional regulator [Lederbergia citrea]|uniref:LacI family DNA-binding transcriptional regulator n=1 Tax=Lederbergia citrea TaxID=2833581 RepID=A0A942UMY6_9BACI|nr:LacI family DNA-binding transcriptional regulator [Lederbergia citrea]MBS4177857.1 LacI family DNA-binding transcriptional regulator [Lederbergia citrea]MBS4223625.1 LacI family DNA-binding transcriptional regulator [Lederbergia citrea]